jgi:hypothetical protein
MTVHYELLTVQDPKRKLSYDLAESSGSFRRPKRPGGIFRGQYVSIEIAFVASISFFGSSAGKICT